MHIMTTVVSLKKWQENFMVVLYNIKIRYTILIEPNKKLEHISRGFSKAIYFWLS